MSEEQLEKIAKPAREIIEAWQEEMRDVMMGGGDREELNQEVPVPRVRPEDHREHREGCVVEQDEGSRRRSPEEEEEEPDVEAVTGKLEANLQLKVRNSVALVSSEMLLSKVRIVVLTRLTPPTSTDSHQSVSTILDASTPQYSK